MTVDWEALAKPTEISDEDFAQAVEDICFHTGKPIKVLTPPSAVPQKYRADVLRLLSRTLAALNPRTD